MKNLKGRQCGYRSSLGCRVREDHRSGGLNVIIAL